MKIGPTQLSRLAFLLAAATPMLVDANTLSKNDQCIRVDLIMLPALAGDYLIGRTELGDVVALKATDDGELKTLGLASIGMDGHLRFAEADLRRSGGMLAVLPKLSEKKQLVAKNGQALKLDPRHLAAIFTKLGLGNKLGRLMMKNEGPEMMFGDLGHVGRGTEVDVTELTLVKKLFFVAEVKGEDTTLIAEAVKAGVTWMSVGSFGHLEGNTIEDVSVSDLSAFGIGIPPASTIAATGAGHTKQAVAAS